MKAFFFFLLACALYAESERIMTLDSLADVYYEKDSGDPVVADSIKALDGMTIRVAGYMVPFNSLENLKEFMLMPSSNGCNFCEAPMKEEMIYVRQPGKKKYEYIGDPLVLTGKLWVKGAGRKAPNATYAQFLYALEDAKLERLKKDDQALLERVTPRTIIKQVCSLLRVRLLKQVTFKELSEEAFKEKRRLMLLSYLGGEAGLEDLKLLTSAFNQDQGGMLDALLTSYLSKWSAAFSDAGGETIYYREGLDLSQKRAQFQIAISCYDLLFHHELDLHRALHGGSPSYDELFARLSLILGLRQSFAQFYGSIGLVNLKPMQEFASPFYAVEALPAPYEEMVSQLLLKSAPFIAEVYQAEQFQPYTKAIKAPPVAMAQVLKPELYTTEGTQYEAPQLEGYENRMGQYLAAHLLSVDHDDLPLMRDGLNFQEKSFTWELEFRKEKDAVRCAELFRKNAKLKTTVQNSRVVVRPSPLWLEERK